MCRFAYATTNSVLLLKEVFMFRRYQWRSVVRDQEHTGKQETVWQPNAHKTPQKNYKKKFRNPFFLKPLRIYLHSRGGPRTETPYPDSDSGFLFHAEEPFDFDSTAFFLVASPSLLALPPFIRSCLQAWPLSRNKTAVGTFFTTFCLLPGVQA